MLPLVQAQSVFGTEGIENSCRTLSSERRRTQQSRSQLPEGPLRPGRTGVQWAALPCLPAHPRGSDRGFEIRSPAPFTAH